MHKSTNRFVGITLYWMLILFLINFVGIILYFLNNRLGFIMDDIKQSAVSFLFQSLCFAIFYLIYQRLFKYGRIKQYAFPVFHLIMSHILFVKNLRIDNDRYYFYNTDPSFTIDYLDITRNQLLNYFSYPLHGIFEGGIFLPDDTWGFYLNFILLPAFAFFITTFIATWVYGRFSNQVNM